MEKMKNKVFLKFQKNLMVRIHDLNTARNGDRFANLVIKRIVDARHQKNAWHIGYCIDRDQFARNMETADFVDKFGDETLSELQRFIKGAING